MSEKYKQVKINLYPEQHDFLNSIAKEKNLTIAQLIREKLDLKLDEKDTRKRYTETQKIKYKKADPRLLYELNKIGNNLNQIAKKLNQNKEVSNIEILQTLVNIETKMKELI
jgi:hypothetical protein